MIMFLFKRAKQILCTLSNHNDQRSMSIENAYYPENMEYVTKYKCKNCGLYWKERGYEDPHGRKRTFT